MIALAIDTSMEAQVLGLRHGDKDTEYFEIAGRDHSKIILPAILDLLKQAGVDKRALDVIIYGRGPGSFTGLRIAVGVVQGLAYGLGIPVVGVSTLACLAQGEFHRSGSTNIVVAQAARKEEVFFGSYTVNEGFAVVNGEEGVFEASSVPRQAFAECAGTGTGWRFKDQLEGALGVTVTGITEQAFPRSRDLLDLGLRAFRAGGGVKALDARPEYLRERVATPNITKV